MSWSPCPDPTLGDTASVDAIETLIVPRAVDLGEMEVRRALPSRERQMVGPFIFFDQMGPAEFLTDQGVDVRPHPHINLATVTYLFEGQIRHRDSLGTDLAIEPGAMNWMRAGRGIVHSERTAEDQRRTGQRLFGIQTWVALPVREDLLASRHDSRLSGDDPERPAAGGAALDVATVDAPQALCPADRGAPLGFGRLLRLSPGAAARCRRGRLRRASRERGSGCGGRTHDGSALVVQRLLAEPERGRASDADDRRRRARRTANGQGLTRVSTALRRDSRRGAAKR